MGRVVFEIDVVSEPSANFSMGGIVRNEDIASVTKYDEGLIKPALLVADKVRLITLREDIAAFVVADAWENSGAPSLHKGICADVFAARQG
jgi:hypothetical protein